MSRECDAVYGVVYHKRGQIARFSLQTLHTFQSVFPSPLPEGEGTVFWQSKNVQFVTWRGMQGKVRFYTVYGLMRLYLSCLGNFGITYSKKVEPRGFGAVSSSVLSYWIAV